MASEGYISPMVASFVHEFGAFFVIFNSARLLKFETPSASPTPTTAPTPTPRTMNTKLLAEARSSGKSLRARVISIFTTIFALTAVAWAWAFLEFGTSAVLLAPRSSLHLRPAPCRRCRPHRRHRQRHPQADAGGKEAVNIGFFFALGHSLVVILMSFCVALTAGALKDRFDSLQQVGGIISSLVSASFLCCWPS